MQASPASGKDQARPLPDVIGARVGTATVLVSTNTGAYHVLNDVGSRVWQLLCERLSTPMIVDRLLEEYAVTRLQLEGDVNALLHQFFTHHLIGASGNSLPRRTQDNPPVRQPRQATAQRGLQVPSVITCGLLLLVTKLSLRFRGYARTIEAIKKRGRETSITTSEEAQSIDATEQAVAAAAAFFPGRALCLEQSLVLYYLLRRHGLPVKYCLGVQPFPLAIHAWVEFCGRPLNDIPEHVRWFNPLGDAEV